MRSIAAVDRPPARRSCGFSLVEVVVVLVVVVLLGGILVVAIQQSRETARRMQCQNHLHQMITAVHSFESTHGRLPSPVGPPFRRKPVLRYSYSFSGHLMLLPHLEQAGIASAFDFSSDPVRLRLTDAEWGESKRQPVSVFLCPSDSVDGGVNVRLSLGGTLGARESMQPDAGAFSVSGGIPMSSVTDGASQTIALSERTKSDDDPSAFDARDYWFTGAAVLGPVSASQMASLCESYSGGPVAFDGYVGHDWTRGEFSGTWFNCLLPPNSPIPDCSANSGAIGATGPPSVGSTSGAHAARSRHPSGVNVAMLDGAVRLTTDSIDRAVWFALGTAAGGDGARLR